MKLTYNKSEKLKRKKTIEILFSEGKSISAYPLQLIYTIQGSKRQVGVSVSKRKFKKAVQRIRIKRLLRESYRLNKTILINNKLADYTFILIYVGNEMPDFELINIKTEILLKKLIKKSTYDK